MNYVDKVGYVKFHEGFDSDHRAIFCDLSKDIMLKQRQPQEQLIRLVGTNSTNTEGTNYVLGLHNELKKHKIYDKL
jgi:hypothetical protein